jgi:hypothetical protein
VVSIPIFIKENEEFDHKVKILTVDNERLRAELQEKTKKLAFLWRKAGGHVTGFAEEFGVGTISEIEESPDNKNKNEDEMTNYNPGKPLKELDPSSLDDEPPLEPLDHDPTSVIAFPEFWKRWQRAKAGSEDRLHLLNKVIGGRLFSFNHGIS